MDILRLQYFVAVAKCQSMTKAAEAIHVAQPALSQAIRRLNEELGVKLFIRVGRNIRLSEMGKLFYTEVAPLVRKLDEMPYILSNENELQNRTININILAGQYPMIDIISNYKRQHPDTVMNLFQDESVDDWDMEITAIDDGNDKSPARILSSEKIRLAVPADYECGSDNRIDLSDMREEGFIALDDSKQFSYITESYCLTEGFEPDVAYRTSDVNEVKNLVGAGIGAAFWLAGTWGVPDAHAIKLLDIRDIDLTWNLYLKKGFKVDESPRKSDFLSYTVDCFAKTARLCNTAG